MYSLATIGKLHLFLRDSMGYHVYSGCNRNLCTFVFSDFRLS